MTPTLTPRLYQKSAVEHICNQHLTHSQSRIVLAASTGSGKTEMSIMIIEHFITAGLGRVLVLAHHTNVIKSNFIERLNAYNPKFSFSDTDQSADCFVTIRSKALSKIDASDFDLLIVDEAHQNYFAKTIQNITCCVSHQVLLTATPSKFVYAGGFDILPIARLDIPNEFFANLHFRVINCDVDLTADDYNSDDKVRTDKNFTRQNIKSMCDHVIPHLDDNKKLFICKDIKQAKQVALYLSAHDIQTYVSDSKCDPDGIIIDNFKSGVITSLCVVDRMRVGYSDNNLFHTIDMSFTHNPDVIMQILSRSNRGDQSQMKTYIKMTNNALNVRTRFMLSIALCLFRADNLIAYDGVSHRNLHLPVVKSDEPRTKSKSNRDTSTNPDDFIIPDNITFNNLFDDCDYISSDLVVRLLSNSYSYHAILAKAKTCRDMTEFRKKFNNEYNAVSRYNDLDRFYADAGFIRVEKVISANITDDMLIDYCSTMTRLRDFKVGYKRALLKSSIADDIKCADGNYLLRPEYVCNTCNTTFRCKRGNMPRQFCSDKCRHIHHNMTKSLAKENV